MRASSPKVGWLCSYSPVEILRAAGLQPIRLRGGASNEALARAYLPAAICPYLKGCLGDALAGSADRVDGVVIANCCDGMRRLADIWPRYLPGFAYLLDVPRLRDDAAVAYFRGRLVALAAFLSDRYGVPVDGNAVRASLLAQNETRRHLAALDDLRQKGLDLSASEMLVLVERSTREAAAEINGWLGDLVERSRVSHHSPRGVPVVVSGNLVTPDNRRLLDLVEAAGGRVVGDDLCNGMRGMAGQMEEEGDPFLALARGYLGRVPCSRMALSAERFEELVRLCATTGARAVLYLSQKFCDGSLYDFGPLRDRLQRERMPSLLLELDATAPTMGQARTRVEAFLEAL